MDTLSGFDYIALHYDDDGKPTSTALADLLSHVKTTGTTDVVLLVHGFRNDEHDASGLYKRFLANFRAHLSHAELSTSMSPRKFAVGGIFWPSKAFSEGPKKEEGGAQSLGSDEELEAVRLQLTQLRDADVRPGQRGTVDKALALLDQLEGDEQKQDEFVSLLLSLVDDTDGDRTEGLQELKAQRGSDLLAKLGAPIILPTVREGEGGVSSIGGGGSEAEDGKPLSIGGFLKSTAGKAGQLLNLTTWYMMKNRSGTVGAEGVATAVRELKKLPGVRVHLVGHSLGGRCMAACAKSLSADPMVQPDSLSLLEAAFSHYGLSADNGHGARGFFRDVIDKSVVKGPFISTYSYQDTVVGTAYAVSSRLAGDNAKAIGDKDDQYGGIGRNGTQRNNEATNRTLGTVGTKYSFTPKVVNNLDGSGGLIKNHSDVTNAEVTYAVASAVAATA